MNLDFLANSWKSRDFLYQRYYQLGLSQFADVGISYRPLYVLGAHAPARLVGKLLASHRLTAEVARALAPRSGPDDLVSAPEAFIGSYVIRKGKRSARFTIDSHDRKDVIAPQYLAESDFYFKANKWGNASYPGNVLPIVNGNGDLDSPKIEFLRLLRSEPKTIDFTYISRIGSGVEHNLRLFETWAGLRGFKSDLLAILDPKTAVTPQGRAITDRLNRAGVTISTASMDSHLLWLKLARSRIVVLRAGAKMCIPWRMIDLLCMGACVFVDSAFYPRWPVALRSDVHYVDGRLDRPEDSLPVAEERYESLKDRLADTLARSDEMQAMRERAAAYFDEHAEPRAVAKYMLQHMDMLD